MYKISVIIMLIGFFSASMFAPDLRGKIMGLLLTLVNYLIFWK